MKYIQFDHQVIGASWSDKASEWNIKVANSEGVESNHVCDIFISASGILNAWRWPDIPGLSSFKGPLLHSARWNDNVDLNGKVVGLIGNGYVLHAARAVLHIILINLQFLWNSDFASYQEQNQACGDIHSK